MRKAHKILTFVLCMAVVLSMGGCGVSHSSPEGVLQSLIEYSQKGKTKKIQDCYGIKKDIDDVTKAEIESKEKYFEAMDAKGITVVSSGVIKEYKTYSYAYIAYNVELGKDKEYPRIETYYVKKIDGDYNVVPTKGISAKMSEAAETQYRAFMLTEPYTQYQKSYETFLRKNPSFEEELATKLS